ncbi:MAG: hypothetical protein ABSF91_06540 [Bacteroidota bacterium]
MIGFVVWTVIILGAIATLFVIVNGTFSKRGAGIATLTAFHDFQPKDKQGAMQEIVEHKAGKKMEEQKTGENKEPDSQ